MSKRFAHKTVASVYLRVNLFLSLREVGENCFICIAIMTFPTKLNLDSIIYGFQTSHEIFGIDQVREEIKAV